MNTGLIKRQDRYDLYGVDGSKIASSSPNPFGKLSIKNCDEIFGIIDIDKLADETFTETNLSLKEYEEGLHIGFKEGFQKAMELNNKLFTVEDMKEAYSIGFLQQGIKSFNSLIQSLKQPKEIEVEIEQVLIQSSIEGEAKWKYRLDENNCLIVKRL